jgi:hypothetical protein
MYNNHDATYNAKKQKERFTFIVYYKNFNELFIISSSHEHNHVLKF